MGKNSKKREAYRQRREKQMEEQGRNVVRWIAIGLGLLFIIIAVSAAVYGS